MLTEKPVPKKDLIQEEKLILKKTQNRKKEVVMIKSCSPRLKVWCRKKNEIILIDF